MVQGKKYGDRGVLRRLLWLVVVAAPLIAGLSLLVVSGKNPLYMDAWKTSWNDEVVYYRAIRLMRLYGKPLGVSGYNEVAAQQLTYGPYNIFTYIPYFLLSFLTGVEGHNYFYICNLILAVLANLLFVILARPSKKQAVFSAMFFVTFLIWARYTWSGMIETSYNFFLIVFTGLVLRLLRRRDPEPGSGKNAAVIAVMEVMIFFWSVMRPFYVPFLLLPLFFAWKRDFVFRWGQKAILTLGTLLSGGGSLFLYMYFGSRSVSSYFADSPSPTRNLIELLSSRSVSYITDTVLAANKDALHEVCEYLLSANWIGAVAAIFYAEWILMFLLWISLLWARRRDGRAFCTFAMLVAGALIYEATVVLYSPIQLHRMMLAVTLSYALLLIHLGDIVLPSAQELTLLALMAFLVFLRPDRYAVPQMDATSITGTQQEIQQRDLLRLLPLEEDPWDNTIAKETEGDDLEYEFLMPSYISFNICQDDVLKEKIEQGTLKSRYVLLTDDSELNEVCEGTGKMKKIWERYGHILYIVR